MRESILPPEFYELYGVVNYVRERVMGKEWSSSCPKCGGVPHKNGELPDRFRMWTHAKIGKPFGWCRVCDYKWTSAKDYKPDYEKIELWRQERIAEEIRRKEEAERAIKLLIDVHKWDEYYSYLISDKNAAAYWEAAGIPDSYWWGEWKLGYDPMHSFWFDTGDGWIEHKTPTATIATRDINKRVINIKHRLINPFDGCKYRMEYRTGIEPIFIANLDISNAEYILKCEGEKKAAVSWLTIDNPKVQAYGLPKSPSDEMLASISGKVIIDIIDPDVTEKEINRTKEKYKHIDYRYLRLPYKIDDMILGAKIDKTELGNILKQARRA